MKCKSSKNILYLLMILAMSIFITFPITANAAVALGSGTSYHTHTGNSSSGGGCYGSKSESGAGMSNHEYWSGNDYVCEYHCAKCGANLGAYLINHWNDAHTAIISTESHTVGNNNHCTITTYSINCGISDSDTHTVTADNALTSNLSSYTLTISSSGITTLDASTPYLFTFVNTSGQIYTQNSTSNVYTISSTMGTGGTITVCVKDRVGSTVQLYSGAVSMHTHSYSKRVYTAATCTTGGNDQYYCSCGDSYLSPTPALGHAPSGWMTNGTHHWKVCTRSGCGAITYAVTEHSFTDWVTDSYSTCTVNGSKHRDCTICGYRQTEVISALGHIPSGWQKDALQHWIICTRTGCGVLTTAKENHTYNSWIVDVSPTCTTAGSRHRDCSVCNYRQTETLNALGHQWPTEYTYETSNGVEKGIAYKNCDRCSTRLETKWLNQIWVRYQDVTGTFGTYTKVVDRYCENGETVSWQRAADASYQGIEKSWVASNKAQIEYLTVYRNSVSLDLISWLDGVKKTDLGNYATADIYINGELVADNCNSYHNTNLLYGSSYEVKNVVTASGYTYNGIHAGTDSLSGTLNGNKQLELEFVRNSYMVTLTAGTGIASVSGSGTYRFEDTVSIDAAVKDGYTWEGWTGTHSFANAANTFPMPAENITITASATANMDTPYMVQHWQQNVDGGDEHTPENYTLADTDDLTGTTDTNVTPAVKSYTGFTAPDTVTVNVDGDGSLVVNYYYTRNSYTVSLSAGSGIASVNGAGTYRFEQEVTINATVMDGYTWAGWNGTHHFDDAATTFYMPAENISITASATANTDTPYKVQHWRQNVDGGDEHTPENYTLADTDDLTGTTDTDVTPEVKSYTGFTAPDTVTVNVDGDGSLVVNYYYTRNSYTVSLSAGSGIASVNGAGTYRFEQEVTINATVMDGYTWAGWNGTHHFDDAATTFYMPAENISITASATANTDTPYKVQHWRQNVDGGDEHTPENYTLADTDDLTGTTDTDVTPEVKSYTGFTAPDTVTVNVDGDGSLVVNYYYTRNSYTVSLSAGSGIASVSGSGTYRFEEEVELNAELITEPPYQFVGWSGTDGFESEEIRRTITMPAYDVVLLAEGTLVQCVSFNAVYTEPVEVGSYINVREITVTAFYSNGKSADITGNTGIAFVDENGKLAAVNRELEAGNYTYTMLYEFNGFKTYSTVDISFVDTIAPVISNAEFLDEWTNELDVTFMVKDNSSGPLRYLLAYSRRYTRDELETMSLQEMVPGELTVNIRKNGSYTLYVVDPSGNMSEKAFTISSIDDIAPVMDVWLHFVDNTGNTRRVTPDEQIPDGSQYITFEVEAKDNETAVEKYRYKRDGAWSEWQPENTFAGIYLNGTYTFEAMDTCGNVSSKTIKLTMLSQKFAVHYLDVDQNGNTIKETIEDKPLGSSVSGAELGTIATTGAYYEGYDYISCDTAVVETSGATVHRYFKLHEFTITYMDADNNVLKTDKVPYGKTSSFGQDMSKPGYQTDQGNYSYVFKGWGNKNGDLVDTTMVKENLTLYPIYETVFHESAQPEDILYVEEDTGSTGYIPDLDSLDLTTIGKMPEYIDQTYEKESSNTGEIPSRYDNSLVVTNIPENKTALSRLFETLESAQGQTVVKTTAAVAGTTVGLSVISLLMQLLSGTGLIQSMIFGYVLLRKKVRYVQGAWMMSEEGMKYVDKFGRKLDVEVHGKQLIFKRKGKIYRAINTEELAEKLRTGRITYNQFEDAVSKSEVYTVFSKDVEIEVYNVKAQSGRIKKKMSGFSLSNNIRNMMRGIGEYSVRINNSGKQILFDVKYAMDNV